MERLSKTLLSLSILIFTPCAYAISSTTVNLTNHFDNNASKAVTSFVSSDIIDHHNKHKNHSTYDTISHTYPDNPKDIKFQITFRNISNIPKNNCPYLFNKRDRSDFLYTDFINAKSNSITMTFLINKDNVLTCHLVQD